MNLSIFDTFKFIAMIIIINFMIILKDYYYWCSGCPTFDQWEPLQIGITPSVW